MPTGYTHTIADGISFEDFVMMCSRAMGALVAMRDAPFDAPIPERFEPSDHCSKELAELYAYLDKLFDMSPEEAEAAAQKDYEEACERRANALAKANQLEFHYKGMLEKVKSWVPPTPDHVGLQNFMIEQITSSIKFDCDSTYYFNFNPVRLNGSQWCTLKRADVNRKIEFYTEEHEKEVQRTSQRNAWLAALRDSLKLKVN